MSNDSVPTDHDQTSTIEKLKEQLRKRQAEFSDRRSSTRLPFGARVSLVGKTEGGSPRSIGDAWVLDVSDDGVSLLTERPFNFNEEMVFDLGSPVTEGYSTPIRVVYCTNLIGSIYRIGVRFIN